jgi:hypothetical protein
LVHGRVAQGFADNGSTVGVCGALNALVGRRVAQGFADNGSTVGVCRALNACVRSRIANGFHAGAMQVGSTTNANIVWGLAGGCRGCAVGIHRTRNAGVSHCVAYWS